ncbi:hypothetical protein [Sorangium sp. So ce385]|uniref:hypothetical protein n=1 Tax=Sorangium sp. So ce385 TaxID=3133308 RepID=UPI003F5BDF7A
MNKNRKPGSSRSQHGSTSKEMIVGERVISDPGSVMLVTELVLSPEAERELTTSATELGKVC